MKIDTDLKVYVTTFVAVFLSTTLMLQLFSSCTTKAAGPITDIEEFIQNKDGTSTLVVSCVSGRVLRFTIKDKDLKNLNIDSLYAKLIAECRR